MHALVNTSLCGISHCRDEQKRPALPVSAWFFKIKIVGDLVGTRQLWKDMAVLQFEQRIELRMLIGVIDLNNIYLYV